LKLLIRVINIRIGIINENFNLKCLRDIARFYTIRFIHDISERRQFTLKHDEIVNITMEYVKDKLEGEGSGHDWWHIYRVYNNALKIAKNEGVGDLFVIKLASLLHDIADWKFYNGDVTVGYKETKKWLVNFNLDEQLIEHVARIVKDISYKGAGEASLMNTIEGKIVQDADRLDAIGAIGIARTFAYGGNKNKEMYNPNIKPVFHENFQQYKNSNGTVINHFYEKLLLLKDLMNTEGGKKYAEERHTFMEAFLEQFYSEWNVNE